MKSAELELSVLVLLEIGIKSQGGIPLSPIFLCKKYYRFSD